jgi:N4-gp56 family major capsid protein
MAITKAQSEVWAAEVLVSLKKELVYAAPTISNRDYVGDIATQGDTVHIVNVSDPTVSTYTPDSDVTIQALTDAETTLVIDQAKSFAFQIDDVHMRQARNGQSLMAQALAQASYKLRDTADTYTAGLMKTGVDSGNALGAKTVNSADTAFKLLIDLRTKLDAANVPSMGRYVVLTPELEGYLLQDSRFVNAQNYGSTEPIQNGRIGRALGFELYKSNNAPAGASAGKIVIAGHPSAVTYADQIASVEQGRMEKRFADFVKGLHLYGAKVVRPTAIATADVTVS